MEGHFECECTDVFSTGLSRPVAKIHEPEKDQRDGRSHYPENVMASGTTGARNDEVFQGVELAW